MPKADRRARGRRSAAPKRDAARGDASLPADGASPPRRGGPWFFVLGAIGLLEVVLAVGLFFYRVETIAIAATGTLLAFAWLVGRAIGPAPAAASPRWTKLASAVGIALIAAGAAMLLRPAFSDREGAIAIAESQPYLPLIAVALLASGIALSLVAQRAMGGEERPFALHTRGLGLIAKLKTELNPYFFFVETWRELDREAAEARAQSNGRHDWRPLIVFTSGALFLGLMEYFGHASPVNHFALGMYDQLGMFAGNPRVAQLLEDIDASPYRELIGFMWWSGWRVLGFFLLPAFVIRVFLRERLTDYGLETRGFLEHAWIYVCFFGIVLVAVVVVSYDADFQTYYPFYRQASRSWYDFWAWEALYAAQFFSLEFFFRGFWLGGGRRAMGSHAIYAMVVPYCMIHFGKPFPETVAAILAGVVLGTLALRTRSIWSGFLIHVSVAISMDMAALLQTTGLPVRWWPDL